MLKIKNCVDSKKDLNFFLDFWRGELVLRSDYKNIIKKASCLFGAESVGINTNGTRISIEDLVEFDPYVSCVGISVDGLENYYNEWRRTVEIGNSFGITINLMKKMLEPPSLSRKLDITTVPTKKNISEIPELIYYLHGAGVRNYSVHRAMQVGRFWDKDEFLPYREDYFYLLSIKEELGINT